jgi:hypothetical protein
MQETICKGNLTPTKTNLENGISDQILKTQVSNFKGIVYGFRVLGFGI